MTSTDSARVARCVVAAAVAGLSVAAFPSVGWADDGGADVAVPAESLAPVTDAVAPLDDGSAGALVEEIAATLGSAGAVVEEATESPPPAPESDARETEPPAEPADALPASDVAGDIGTSGNPDTSGDRSDSTSDIAAADASAPVDVAPATAVVVQSAPSNLSVSVRIDSPGDDGAVTQVNLAAAATVADGASSGAREPTSAEPSTVLPTAGSQAADPARVPAVSAAGAPAVSTAEEPDETWSWEWDCLSLPPFSAISPTGSTSQSVPRTWTWIWNCGDNAGQYRDATASQYQPVNVNVSVRLGSPGDNGPVAQSNVVVAVSAGRPAAPASPPPARAPDAPTGSLPGLSALPGLSSLPALPAVLSPLLSGAPSPAEPEDLAEVAVEVVVESTVAWFEDPTELSLVFPPPPEGGASAWIAATGLSPGIGVRPVGAGHRIRPSAFPIIGPRPPVIAARAAPSAPGEPEVANARKRARPAPHWKTPEPTVPASESAPFGATAAAATGGGSSSGGLPIFLALPFLAAMLDLARRVALQRVALPSGHRSRMPDRPG